MTRRDWFSFCLCLAGLTLAFASGYFTASSRQNAPTPIVEAKTPSFIHIVIKVENTSEAVKVWDALEARGVLPKMMAGGGGKR